MTVANKKWKKEEIQLKMETDNKWLYRGLMVIYQNQTADERNAGVTSHSNGIGFTGADASYLTAMALRLKNYGHLGKQLANVRRAMVKYAGQLAKVANQKSNGELS